MSPGATPGVGGCSTASEDRPTALHSGRDTSLPTSVSAAGPPAFFPDLLLWGFVFKQHLWG